MGPKTERLIEVLGETVVLLREYDEGYYANWMVKGKHLLKRSDFRGITHVLAVYGGMGSFNDIYLAPKEGEADDSSRISANARFKSLSTTIYELAESIRREVERNDS